ncbi:cyclic nucleotide-binding/CBS domain-containing protein [Haliangium ochraceum]|uniref:CBS domain containing protein n=1 Tax=Haliangium ochraceum (strain DSM 14365 / JCM 11303 / SMP-2) TaxID=502025 RepID=D0LSG3_HALO1|nr:CBS domain-containing protein [Haliangium ochraceum]ACY15662.1 CBS domain containing protein [Haliangium ochraceum DSM 14365]
MLKEIAATPVSEVTIREPVRVSPEAKLIDVVNSLREKRRGAAIIEDGGSVVGIFTERDLMLRVDHSAGESWHDKPVRDFMTGDVVMVKAQDSISVAVQKMRQGLFRHLPVDLGPGKPVRLVSIRDVLAYIAEHFPAEFLNLPPDPEHEATSRWGG